MKNARFGLRGFGGLLLALGFTGITVITAFYASVPPSISTPAQPFDAAKAIAGAVSAASALRVVGILGMISDVVASTGAFLILMDSGLRDRGTAAAGWAGQSDLSQFFSHGSESICSPALGTQDHVVICDPMPSLGVKPQRVSYQSRTVAAARPLPYRLL